MTKIAELKDKGAVVAWSPLVGEYADVIALGSKVCIIIDMLYMSVIVGTGWHLFFMIRGHCSKVGETRKYMYKYWTKFNARVDINTNILKAHIFVWSFFLI